MQGTASKLIDTSRRRMGTRLRMLNVIGHYSQPLFVSICCIQLLINVNEAKHHQLH